MNRMEKSLIGLFGCVFMICFFLSSAVMAAESEKADEDRVVRVSCPLQDGFFEIDKYGDYSGYSYEYLMKIAQRTGWKYEFVICEPTNEELQAALDQLKTGEIDLMASMVYSEALAEIYEYVTVPYGGSNFTLLADENNEFINERTFYDLTSLRVAMEKGAEESNTRFDDFCKEEGISYQAIYVPETSTKQEMVKNGEADVFISKDIVATPDFKTVVPFSYQPFYFAATKGNTSLTEEIGRVIMDINNTHPYFNQTLHDKYFKFESDYRLSLTKDEQEYIKTLSTLRMVILTDKLPISDYDAETQTFSGIIIGLLEKLSEEIPFFIEYIPAESMKEAYRLLDTGKADAIAGFPYSYNSAEKYDVLLTSPIFAMPIVRISNLTGEGNQENILVSSSIRVLDGMKKIQYEDDLTAILDLVNKGEYREAYVNGYLAHHKLERNHYPNIVLTQTPYSNYEVCIGIQRNSDLRLVSILEQMVSNIKIEDIEDIVYQNTIKGASLSSFEVFRRNPVAFFAPVLLFSAVIIALLLILFFKTKRLNKIIFKEKTKYQKISTMDRLAQTYNNDTFKDMSKDYLSQQGEPPCGAFFICDIDDFKSINDTYGHLVGDDVIRRLGELLKTIFHENAIVGRLGGDEFVVLMKETGSQDKIVSCCEEMLEKSRSITDECEIGLSIGVAVFSGNVAFDELFVVADKALYAVKARGKNSYEIVSAPA